MPLEDQVPLRGSRTPDPLQWRYDRMWQNAIVQIRDGNVESDSLLAEGAPDARRGLTLIAQPDPVTQAEVQSFLEELSRIEPDQHYYHPSAFHLTILSLFTATVDPQPYSARTVEYTRAVDETLNRFGPFRVSFRGVTASPGAILIQGFLEDDTLNRLRDALRQQLHACALAESLDARYRLETAHMTVVRFRAPLRNPKRFADRLERARSQAFGAFGVKTLSLVKNDWYMTDSTRELVKSYSLHPPEQNKRTT